MRAICSIQCAFRWKTGHSLCGSILRFDRCFMPKNHATTSAKYKNSSPLGHVSVPRVSGVIAWLRRCFMGPTPITRMNPGGLGIHGLPGDLGEFPCGSPTALIANDEGSYRIWMPAVLKEAVTVGPVCLLSGDWELTDDLLQHDALAQAHASGQLSIWQLGPGLGKCLHSNGLLSLWKDLNQVGLSPQRAVFIMPANALLTGRGMQQLMLTSSQLQQWCAARLRPVVLCLSPDRLKQPQGAARMVRGLSHVFLHVASLGQQEGRPKLYLERWEGNQGALFDACFGLLPPDNTQQLSYDGSLTVGKVPELASAPDQFYVIATEAVVRGKKGVPAHWKIVDSDNGVRAAARNAIAATVIIDAGQTQDFEAKAKLVHRLRLSHPRTLRILVRETHGKLRANFEQALLRLGANEVLYREMGFQRVLQYLQESTRHAFTQDVPADYSVALSGFMPASARGYQRPSLFCDEVRDMLDSTHGLNVVHSLVRLRLLPRMPHLDAILACRMSRNGDLLTADSEALYVFLFACPESELEAAMHRLFALPLSQLCISQVADFTDVSIMAVIKALAIKDKMGLPDFSHFLDKPMGSDVLAPSAAPLDVSSVQVSVAADHLPVASIDEVVPAQVMTEGTFTDGVSARVSLGVHRKPIAQRHVLGTTIGWEV
jgi:cellulose biosynthesis protein BcsE